MKDFARTQPSLKNKFLACLKKIFNFLFLFAKVFSVFLILFILVLLFLWFVIPGLLVGNTTQNFVFNITDICSKERQKYYVFFDGSSSSLKPYRLNEECFVQIIKSDNPQQLSTISLTDYYLLTDNETSNAVSSAWLIGALIEQEISIERSCDESLGNLEIEDSSILSRLTARAFLKNLQQNLASFNLSLAKQGLDHWLMFKISDWEDMKVLGEQEIPGNLFQSDCTAAVLNATNVSGYAQAFSSVLESSGIRVIRVDSWLKPQEESSVFISQDSKCAYISNLITVQLLQDAQKIEKSDQMTQRYRADMVIVLGEEELPNLMIGDGEDSQELAE